jgi:hypothetical protein
MHHMTEALFWTTILKLAAYALIGIFVVYIVNKATR